MEKVGRNDPCPCGSGKKYKKCHGASNVIEITPAPYNHELDELHVGLNLFAMEDYQSELSTILEEYPFSVIADEVLREMYLTGLTVWAIMHKRIQGDQTIFDLYAKKEQNKIKHERVRQTFAAWKGIVPSIYEIHSVTDDKVFIKDGRTEKTYDISPAEPSEFAEGNSLIGILLPYVQEYRFLFQMLEIPDLSEEKMSELKKLTDTEMVDHFPDILEDLLLEEEVELNDMEWKNPQYKMVADLFTSHAIQKEADERIISAGLSIWMMYIEEEEPMVRKPESYAAALEYVIQRYILSDPIQSQKELAEEYGTSPATISKHSQNILSVVKEEIASGVIEDMVGEVSETLEAEGGSRLMMERMLRDVGRALEEEEIETEEDLEAFMDRLNLNEDVAFPPPESPRDKAQDLLFEAYQSSGKKREKLIQEALELYPNSTDAYLLMAEDARSLQERFQLIYKAVIAGEKDLGEEFFKENKGDFWLMTETRPYMRAKEALARTQYELNNTDEALAMYEEILELNPNDNQGIRYVLLNLYLETGRFNDADAILKEYEDSLTTGLQFNKCLLFFFRDGLTEQTKKLLKEADKSNPHVKHFLTRERILPSQAPTAFRPGDESEAVIYLHESMNLWKHASPLIEEIKNL